MSPYRLVHVDPRTALEARAIATLLHGAVHAHIAFVAAFAAVGVVLGDLVALAVERDARLNGLTLAGATGAGLLVLAASAGLAVFAAEVLRRPWVRAWAQVRIEALVRAGVSRDALEPYAMLF